MSFSESFPHHVNSPNAMCPPSEYFTSLLCNLVHNVIPQCNSKVDTSNNGMRPIINRNPTTSQPGSTTTFEGQKAFYQIQDPGTYTQLILETAVIEILSLPVTAAQIVSALVQIIIHIQPTLTQSNHGLHGSSTSSGQGSALPTSPSGAGSTDSLGRNRQNATGMGFVSRSGYASQQLSCLMIQACGLLLAQLPAEFHIQLYAEASRVIKESWWLMDSKRSASELDSAVAYALLDPTCAAQDNTSTVIGKRSSYFFL